MTQSHYSLKWNNHQNHILAAFEALLQAETLVDVTLVCSETSVRAHKVVLSACSPFFQRIFAENPCKHPVIVLKDFSGWEVQAIVDFMYKGEISVIQEQLQNLIKAAESLQVRGLAQQQQQHQDDHHHQFDKESTSILNQTPTPSNSPNDYNDGPRHYFPGSAGSGRFGSSGARTPSFSPPLCYEPAIKLPHMSRLSFPETLMPRQECQSPTLPRRKQARPRRRSGEMCGPQDLSSTATPTNNNNNNCATVHHQKAPASPMIEETAENLCMKKPSDERMKLMVSVKDEDMTLGKVATTPTTPTTSRRTTPDPDGVSPEMDLSMQSSCNKEFSSRTSPPVSLPPTLNMKQEIDNHSPLPFPPMPSVSALAMTPPHSKFFGLDSPLGLFPPGLDGCRNPLFDMPDPRTTPDTQMFVKKKMGRPKGQHSAPRGGPPRSWTNAELTEALQHVWNKKMTTSQASRIFGIPYNSLLMYVRGKYGKSLKLEQLRKDCIGGPPSSMDLLGLGANNNNNSLKAATDAVDLANNRPASADEHQQQPPPPVFNPFAHSFYPDFGTGFPIPVSMIHLLPQSEKSRVGGGGGLSEHYGQQAMHGDDDCKKEMDVVDEQDLFRSAAALAAVVDDRRELVQQNGQD